jgi:undecaprenyl-diphosphatase
VVQGLSEFLPISSSGHLVLVPWVFGWEELSANPELNRSFDVALHIGTFAGAFAYFRHDVARLAQAAARSLRGRELGPDARLAWLLVVASLPAAMVGALLDTVVEGSFGPEWLVGVMMIVFGVVLYATDRVAASREMSEFGVRDAVLMGVAQALALQPGVSRSGVTISTGRWLRFDRDAAARISFLMSLPIIGGAGLYEGIDVVAGGGVPPAFVAPFVVGTAASAVTGFVAVWGVLRLVRHASFTPFVLYRVLVGLAVIAIALAR